LKYNNDMKYEREGLLLPKQTEAPEDQHLYESFRAAHLDAQETYKELTLKADKKAQVLDRWHSGENASLVADHLDDASLESRLDSLTSWKRELLAEQEIDQDIKQAYRWRINEDIASVYMLKASADGDMRNFRRWNEFIYGAPDEDIYRGALDWVANDADVMLAKPDQPAAVVAAAEKVAALLKPERGYRELLAPEEDTFKEVREDHLRATGYYALLLAGTDIPREGKITNEVGDPALQHIVKHNLQSDYAIADAAGSTWGVAHSKEVVERPKAYNMPWQRFVGLGPGHEIGSHLLERVNGARGPVALAEDGLDRYELGNEGRAVSREQVPYETFDEFGKLVRWRDILRRHIAISYAHGVGDSEPKASSEVYEFMNAIDTMYQAKLTPDDSELTKQKAEAKTDALLTRVLKGTDGTGGAYLKDKVYLEGHVACWLTASLEGPQVISEGDLGKFDINNPRHIALLQKKGLLPVSE
jgi:hypothetical protein